MSVEQHFTEFINNHILACLQLQIPLSVTGAKKFTEQKCTKQSKKLKENKLFKPFDECDNHNCN